MVKQIIYILLATFAINLVNTEVVNWSQCDSQTNCEIKEVRMSPCNAAPAPCKFKRGSSAAMEFDFVPSFEGTAGNLKGEIFWVSPKGDLLFEGMNTDACSFTNCPLVSNQQQTYNFSIVTARIFPIRTYTIKMKLTGDDNKECCFTTKIRIARS